MTLQDWLVFDLISKLIHFMAKAKPLHFFFTQARIPADNLIFALISAIYQSI